jgi:hypothetical protein
MMSMTLVDEAAIFQANETIVIIRYFQQNSTLEQHDTTSYTTWVAKDLANTANFLNCE